MSSHFVSVCDATSTTSSLKFIPKKKKKPSPFKPPPVHPNLLPFLQQQQQQQLTTGHLDHFIQSNHVLPENLSQPLSLPLHVHQSQPSPSASVSTTGHPVVDVISVTSSSHGSDPSGHHRLHQPMMMATHFDVNSIYGSNYNPYVTSASLNVGYNYPTMGTTHPPPPPPASRGSSSGRSRPPPPPSASFLDAHHLMMTRSSSNLDHHQRHVMDHHQQLQQQEQHLPWMVIPPSSSSGHLQPLPSQPTPSTDLESGQPSPATTTSQLSRSGSVHHPPPTSTLSGQSVSSHGLSSRPKCSYCAGLIIDDECTEAENGVYHIKCFACTSCRVPLGGLQYIMHGQGLTDDQPSTSRSPYCTSCFDQLFGDYCEGCGQLIHVAKGSAITHESRSWHASADCFNCHFCRRSLLGLPFLPHSSGFIYCSVKCSKDEVNLHNSIKMMARAGLEAVQTLQEVPEEDVHQRKPKDPSQGGIHHPSPQPPNSSDSGCPSAESGSVSHSPNVHHDQGSTEKGQSSGDQESHHQVAPSTDDGPPPLPSCDPPPSTDEGDDDGKDNEGFEPDDHHHHRLLHPSSSSSVKKEKEDDDHNDLPVDGHPSSSTTSSSSSSPGDNKNNPEVEDAGQPEVDADSKVKTKCVSFDSSAIEKDESQSKRGLTRTRRKHRHHRHRRHGHHRRHRHHRKRKDDDCSSCSSSSSYDSSESSDSCSSCDSSSSSYSDDDYAEGDHRQSGPQTMVMTVNRLPTVVSPGATSGCHLTSSNQRPDIKRQPNACIIQ